MNENGNIHDLSYHISSSKLPQENINGVFRRQYPKHVKAIKKCVKEILDNPESNSIAIISFYGLNVDFFKKVIGLPNFRKSTLLKHKKKNLL
jgi:hypothetical protein